MRITSKLSRKITFMQDEKVEVLQLPMPKNCSAGSRVLVRIPNSFLLLVSLFNICIAIKLIQSFNFKCFL